MRHKQTTLSFEELLEEAGWTAKVEARGMAMGEVNGVAKGKERKAIEVAQNMIKLELPFETIVSATGLGPEKVKALYQD